MQIKTTTTRPSRKKTIPLIVEPHPKGYVGFPFITLIQYRKSPILTIVDNADDETIRAFVLDLCGPEEINEELLLGMAADWYDAGRSNYPISVEFSKHGLTLAVSKIYRVLNIEFVSRVIGPVPKYPMNIVKSVKRRRRKPIPAGVEILTADNVFEQR